MSPRVVIAGAGFGGLETVRALAYGCPVLATGSSHSYFGHNERGG